LLVMGMAPSDSFCLLDRLDNTFDSIKTRTSVV
jgi:hypothetical protein